MAKIKKAQHLFSWVVILSECSHIFCCVLPTMFSVLSVLVGMGLIGVMPIWMDQLHHMMHGWEIPVITGSGIVVLIGWVLHHVSRKMDCHDTGCVHGACEPKKKNTVLVLQIATFLFVINVFVYLFFHHGLEVLGFIHE
jgi:hypothetical protein